MKAIELFCIGELKFRELRIIEEIYAGRISTFMTFSIRKFKDINVKDPDLVKKKEAQKILKNLSRDDFVIGLDETGRKMDSHGFARFLSELISYHFGRIVFLIGGFSGLSGLLDERINEKISFSDLTFSHDIFRIVFLEQLYRAFTIIKGIPYHR
jgi:23S rRNA (pseudouridine1915-N3)-methyltransferase